MADGTLRSKHFRDHVLLYTLTPLIMVSGALSLYRFIIVEDYSISFNGACDPYTQNCFVECSDAECVDTFYYAKATRHANALKKTCGESILGCAEAAQCPSNESGCSVTFCDPQIDGASCEALGNVPLENESSDAATSTPEAVNRVGSTPIQ